MNEDDKRELRKKFAAELIEFGFMLAFVVAVQYMHDDAGRERMKMRLHRLFRPEQHDPLDVEVQQFAQQISDWEHEEQGR